jgi:hypothetical protein
VKGETIILAKDDATDKRSLPSQLVNPNESAGTAFGVCEPKENIIWSESQVSDCIT